MARLPFVSGGPAVPPVTSAASALADAEGFIASAELSRAAEFPDAPQVEYPREAYRLGRAGRVFVEVWIDADGSAVRVQSMRDSDEEFAAAAMTGLRKSRFRPAEQNGKPVKSRAYFVVHFVLE
jgi:TonB family protein